MGSLILKVQISCYLIQNVALQMNYQQTYYQNPMQYYPNTMMGAEMPQQPTPKRRSGKTKKKDYKKRHHRSKSRNIQRSYTSDESSCETSLSNSGSASASEECQCTCDQCTQPIQCCIEMCNTCPNPNPGIVFVPYPYPMIITQQSKSKNKEKDEEILDLRSRSRNKNEFPITERKTTTTTTTAPTSTSTTTTTETTTTETTTTTTEPPTTEKETTVTTEVPKSFNRTLTESPKSQYQTLLQNYRPKMDLSDFYDYSRYRNYTEEVEALYKELRRKDRMNDIISNTTPKTVGDMKYVLTSHRKVKDDYFPKFGIVPIPDSMAAELMKALRGMSSIQLHRDTENINKMQPQLQTRKSRYKDSLRLRAPYTEHLYRHKTFR